MVMAIYQNRNRKGKWKVNSLMNEKENESVVIELGVMNTYTQNETYMGVYIYAR
jgi:hypothetical protein